MTTIWDYPVSFIYGYSAAYGPEFHFGEDRTVTDKRTDIEVTVNGVSIGLAGTTGESTGIHCHIGKWQGGQSFNPAGGGQWFKSAVVTEVDTIGNTKNGKFVRIQGDGFSWVYLHLSSVKVRVGQVLQGDPMEVIDNTNEARMIALEYGLEIAGDNPFLQRAVGQTELAYRTMLAPTISNTINNPVSGYKAQIAALEKALAAATGNKPDPDGEKWRTFIGLINN